MISPSSEEDQDDGDLIEKVKFSKSTEIQKSVVEDYDPKVVTSKIFLELELTLDEFKSVNERSSSQILDLFGDVGGFKEALLIIFGLFGEYFSANFFSKEIANKLYFRKQPPK